MHVLRTPESQFNHLPDFPYTPHYAEIPSGEGQTLRMHYVDEGPRDAPALLMLHGEPSWCFLYRKIINVLLSSGFRAIAPDLIGFGRSDKPSSRADYSYQRHVDWVRALLDILNPSPLFLLCQDWGGLIGLRIAGEQPERFDGIIAANTFLPTGDQKLPDAFFQWREFSQSVPQFPVGQIVSMGCARPLSPETLAAYNAPFVDESFKEGARAFPVLVPASPEDPAAEANRKAWKGLLSYQKPFLTAFGDSDPITRGADKVLQNSIPGAAAQAHITLSKAGHFLQEDVGEELGQAAVNFMNAALKR